MIHNDIKKVSNEDKTAIVFLCLGEERGSTLMQQMEESEITRISRAMASLGMVSSNVVEDVLTEFAEGMSSGGGLLGNFTAAEKYLTKFMSADQVEEIMRDVRGPLRGKNMWDRFSALNENIIAGYLKGENPQTIAAILSKVKADVPVKVLPLLPRALMQDVIERMIKLEAIPRGVLEEIESTLETDFVSTASSATTVDPHQRMADIFNKFDVELFKSIAEKLDEAMPDDIARIKQKMFTFEDLVRLDVQSLSRVMRDASAENGILPVALKGADKSVRDYFLSALPERSRNMLVDEISTRGAVRMREVQEAQSTIVDIAKNLADEGAIRLPMNEDDDVIIE